MKAAWIPNILSGLRVLLAFLFPVVARDLWVALLTAALLTEFLDGFLARKFHWVTSAGQLLDPVADRLFVLSTGLTLMSAHRILPIELLLVLTRDFVVALGLLTALVTYKSTNVARTFKPNLWGKATTVFQYLVFYDVLLFLGPHRELIWLTGVLSVTSATLYSI